eukprot:s3094_g16.t1
MHWRRLTSWAQPQAPFRPVAVGKTAMPVSSLLHGGGLPKAMDGLHGLLGPPPPTRAAPQVASPQLDLKFPEDEPSDPLQPAEDLGPQSPMAMALLEQSRPLRALMAHFHSAGSDPMSDLSSAVPTRGVKGTMAREKLQRELGQGVPGHTSTNVPCLQATYKSFRSPGYLFAELPREVWGLWPKSRAMVQWSLGHAFDAAAKEEWGAVLDHLAKGPQGAAASGSQELASVGTCGGRTCPSDLLLEVHVLTVARLTSSGGGYSEASTASWAGWRFQFFPLATQFEKEQEGSCPQTQKSCGSHHPGLNSVHDTAAEEMFPCEGGLAGFSFSFVDWCMSITRPKLSRSLGCFEACDRSEPIRVSASGRRNLQLMARLQELASAAECLGLTRRPYQEQTSQAPVPLDNSIFPQLNPFSNLNPDRLKITGRGQWDASSFIEPELYMPFLEPQVLELSQPVFERGVPNFGVDGPETVFVLFKKWDDLDLLVLHPRSEITTGDSGRVKIVNSFKSATQDRQIGDRRERNAWEGKIPGPSSALPVGPLIGRLVIPDGFGVQICITDRSDYYHQIGVSHARSRSNVVWPPMPLSKFVELKAYKDYCQAAASSMRKKDRTVIGDYLRGHRPGLFSLDPAVEAFYQKKADLLLIPWCGPVGFIKDCIDDYFCIAPVPLQNLQSSSPPPSEAKKAFDRAKTCYAQFGLPGSDQKDVVDEMRATVVGAEANSSPSVVSKGVLPVGAPASKRLALSWISAAPSRLPVTSDALHSSLLGGLVSVFCYKKCSMSLLQDVFQVIPAEELDTSEPVTRELTRAAAEKLILSAVLLPGIQGRPDFLDSEHRAVLAGAHAFEEEDWEKLAAEEFGPDEERPPVSVSRPLAQRYDFLEVCGGSGVVSDQMSALGFVVGPIIDITYSSHYDLLDMRVVEWLIFMVQNRRVRSIALEPPCTTFSPAAYPPVRSYKVPRGFNQSLPKVWVGNRLALACLTILFVAAHCLVMALLETPRRSKMAWLAEWKRLLDLPNVEETFTASCSFGSPHQKEFRFLVANMRASSLCKPCSRDHSHIKIEGQLTKGSAVYCPGLANAIAILFAKHLVVEQAYAQQHAVKSEGLESLFLSTSSCEALIGREWLRAKGQCLDVLLSAAYTDPEVLASHLVAYGKEQYAAGRPYNHYAETINAIGAAKPTVRRFLTAPWDTAFSWVQQEPGEHHTACLYQVLLALLSASIYWGWSALAGAIALSWGAVCRIGEEPKTRFKAARHQMSRLDYQDLVELVSCVFGSLSADKKLWPFSGQLMRTRFRQLLTAIGLPARPCGRERPLDLGSLRAGGATHLLMTTEDSELVRRRGRWLAHRTMEVYLQEIAATIMFPSLPDAVKAKVLRLAYAFPGLLEKVKHFTAAGIPDSAWHVLLRSEQTGKAGTMPGAAPCKHADARENDVQMAE